MSPVYGNRIHMSKVRLAYDVVAILLRGPDGHKRSVATRLPKLVAIAVALQI
jgi:hypothetical protein